MFNVCKIILHIFGTESKNNVSESINGFQKVPPNNNMIVMKNQMVQNIVVLFYMEKVLIVSNIKMSG